MALGHAPSIIMDGIVAYIDVANVRSYPGSGDVVTDLINGFLSTGTGISASQMSAIGATFGTNKNTSFSNELITVSNTSYTKCCWFNLEDVSTYQPLICGTLYQRHCMWMNKTDKLTASHSNTTPFSSPTFTSIAGTTTLSTGIWYFGAVTYSSTSGFNIYLNNRRDQTSATTQTFGTSVSGMYFGYFGEFYTSPALPNLNGTLGPMMYYNRVLSAQEILQNYNATKRRYGF
jgi:hypothetical protein